MSVIDSIKKIFTRKKSIPASESVLDIPLEIASENTDSTMVYEDLVVDAQRTSNAQDNIPDWLVNEDILRDEGVIFGLSGSHPEEKLSIIRNYFVKQTAAVEKVIEYEEEKIGELNYWIEEKERLVTNLEKKIEDLKNLEFTQQHQLPRTIVGLCLAIGVAVGNYYLIEVSLKGQFEQHELIAMGVFGAGMFSLFGRVSFLHDEEKNSSWRKVLEEIGMPFAAAFFVFAQIFPKQPALNAWALFAFIFFLFLFAGKLLLGNLTLLKDDLTIYQKRNQLAKDKIKKVKEWEEEIGKHKAEIDKFRKEKYEVLPVLTKAIAERTRHHAQRDMLIKIFESEYYLAVKYRTKLGPKDLEMLNIMRGGE